jgi:hypothetical protein
MTGLRRFLLRVTLRRLDFAEEVYHLREPKRLPLVAAGVRKPAQLRTSAVQQGCISQ